MCVCVCARVTGKGEWEGEGEGEWDGGVCFGFLIARVDLIRFVTHPAQNKPKSDLSLTPPKINPNPICRSPRPKKTKLDLSLTPPKNPVKASKPASIGLVQG